MADIENTEVDFLNLSDEEFEKFGSYPPTSFSASTEEESTDESNEDDNTLQDDTNNESADAEDDDEEEESEQGEVEDEAASSDESDEEESEESDDVDTKTTDEGAADAQSFYDMITAPMKANGKEINIKTPEEAKQLIQMGINYNSKMAALKPARQLIKTLEQNKMLDEESIGFAVDLLSGSKDAILKLMQDKGINPLELDTDEQSVYKPNTKLASSQAVEFDDVIESIKSSTHYDSTIDTVQAWDEASQIQVSQDPRLIQLLNSQMENGVYSTVASELEKRRTLGDDSLTGLSDLEAYVAVGRLLNQQGQLAVPTAQGKASTNQVGSKVQPKAGSRVSPKTQSKKKAAGLPRGKSAEKGTSLDDVNPLAMSDDDFDKLMAKFT
jgi:hypothetical protein